MAIQGTLNSTVKSADFTPSAAVSDAAVNIKSGSVFLMATVPAVGVVTVTELNGSGTLPISTSDTGITYHFLAGGTTIDVDFYMGP